MKGVFYALISLTNRCNLSCKMCGISLSKENRDLDPLMLKNFFSNFPNLQSVVLTGGEPSLYIHWDKLVGIIRERIRVLSLVTNGFNSDRILNVVKFLCESLPNTKIKVSVSLDGTKKTHDEIRGKEGAYEKAIQTFFKLKRLSKKYTNFYPPGFHFTLTSYNARDLEKLLLIGFPVSCTVSKICDVGISSVKKGYSWLPKEKDIKMFLETLKRLKPGDSYGKLLEEITKENLRKAPCVFRDKKGLFLDVDGKLYLCDVSSKAYIGDIYESHENLIKKREEVIRELREICQLCPSNCFFVEGLFEKLVDWLKTREIDEVVVYGYGSGGLILSEILRREGIRILYYVDRKAKDLKLPFVKEPKPPFHGFIVISSMYEGEIREQLESYELREFVNYISPSSMVCL